MMKGKRNSSKKKSDAVQYPHQLGFNAQESIQNKAQDALGEFEKEMEWLYELLYECKKTFIRPEVQFLPKTPSQKRGRKPKRPAKWMDEEDVFQEPPSKRLSTSRLDEDEDADVEDFNSPPTRRNTRTRAASRAAASTRPKRNTRNTKTVKIKTDTEEPVFSMTKELSVQTDGSSNEIEDVNATPVNKVPSANMTPFANTASDLDTPKACQIDNIKETPKPADKNTVVQETPEIIYLSSPVTPKTVVRQNVSDDKTPVSCIDKQSVEESVEIEPQDNKADHSSCHRKSRTSVRKSLKHGKTLNSSARLSSIKRLSIAALHKVEAAVKSISSEKSVLSETKSSETKSTRPRTRLRLKKGSQNTDSVTSVSSQESVSDNENSTEEEQPQRTRTKARKANKETSAKTRTKLRNKRQSEQEMSSIDLSDDEVMLIDHDTPQKDSDKRLSASGNETGSEHKREGPRTRTKQKTSSQNDSEDDSGITSMNGANMPRTRSKMRPPKGSASDREDNFAKPDHPAPRTRTKKRVLSDDEADMSISKKSCMDESASSDISVGAPVGSSTFLSTKNDGARSTDDEGTSCSDYDSPICPRDKVIRPKIQKPSFQHNLSNKIVVQNKPGIVKSFIKRNSPAKKLTSKEIQELKKKELQEKEKKEQERLLKRQIEMQHKIEEQRRKNEEKAKKFAEAREQQAKRDQEMRDKILKRFEEKRQQNEKQKEEKAKEELKRQQQKLKKQQEADERRKREEEEQQQKQQKLEEENKVMQETLEKKREIEEQKRQMKIAEEKRKYEERLTALAKERQEEQETLRKKEEQKLLEQQKIKEQREKQLALEKAEREKRAIEEKKQKDQLLKERMEKIKELEKKRIMEEEKRRAELREHEEAVRKIINNHNTSLQNTKEEILKTAMSAAGYNLNTTQTYSSKPHNPDSYDMTPAKTYKPSTFDTYDISGLKSDDSTDDEDAPKKKIPAWASGPNLKAALINQLYYPPDLEQMFDAIVPPDLNELFSKKKARFNKRTSSAHWDSPILPPGTVGLHTGLTYF